MGVSEDAFEYRLKRAIGAARKAAQGSGVLPVLVPLSRPRTRWCRVAISRTGGIARSGVAAAAAGVAATAAVSLAGFTAAAPPSAAPIADLAGAAIGATPTAAPFDD